MNNSKGVYVKAARLERIQSGQWLDIPAHEKLWNEYCEHRDALIDLSKDCEEQAPGSTPPKVRRFLTDKRERFFAVGMPPQFYIKKNQLRWLRRALARVKALVAAPNGKIKPKSN
jgi:hypothetical protein